MDLHISVAHRLIGTVSSQLLCNKLYSQLDVVSIPDLISLCCVILLNSGFLPSFVSLTPAAFLAPVSPAALIAPADHFKITLKI
jgi:hypothetical protein